MITTGHTDLSPDEKLALLRRIDRWRLWKSLDDQRLCLGCGRLISGHEIDVVLPNDGADSAALHCPTAGCQSIALDWILPRSGLGT